jgi:hypothetical protein
MSNLTTAWMLGCVCGFFLGITAQGWRRRSTCRELMRERQPTFADLLMPPPRDRDPDWRRSFSHENTNQPSGPPPLKLRRSDPVRMEEGHTQRGNGSGGPTTPKPPIKPQPAGGRMIDQSGMTIGYQPLPRSGRTTTPPPREP